MNRHAHSHFAEPAARTLCAVRVGSQRFGIDTARVREVLGPTLVQRVPLAPANVAGMISYRGDVLTAVSLHAVLGGHRTEAACILVLRSCSASAEEEPFGLAVDEVQGVVDAGRELLGENALSLPLAFRHVCRGAFRTERGLILELDPEKLHPSHRQPQWANERSEGHAA